MVECGGVVTRFMIMWSILGTRLPHLLHTCDTLNEVRTSMFNDITSHTHNATMCMEHGDHCALHATPRKLDRQVPARLSQNRSQN